MSYFNKNFIKFFRGLRKNNKKEWFDENREFYIDYVKEPFEKFVGDLIEAYRAEYDSKLDLSTKEAIFRINRDTRFSKDKTPYKLHMGAVICWRGRKNMTDPCLYVQLSGDDVRIYSGLYMIEKEKLSNLRNYIADNLVEFGKLISDKKFVKVFGGICGEKNKRLPKQLAEVFEKQPLIANKEFYYFKSYQPEIILEENLIDLVMKDFAAAEKMNKFLSAGMNYNKQH